MISRADRRALARGLATAGLMGPAAFAVHQLRYVLAFGSAAGVELQRQGHAYLHSLVPWVIVLLALAAGGFLRALGRAFSGQNSLPRYTLSFAALWIACAGCLLAIYAVQELLEGFVLTGHPAGLVGIFGYGGWWSIPAAWCVGLVLAAIFHGARWVLGEVARRSVAGRTSPQRRSTTPRPPIAIVVRRPAPLAGGWSGRGPPR